MALTIPPELKKISAYVRRAEELDKDTGAAESRLVAYYCRQYAVHTGIPLASTSPAAKECLGSLLGALEEEKPAMDNFTREEAKFLCKSFAERVFNKADEEDRLGVANKATAKTFYAAATFLQILDQFIEDGNSEMEEIKKKVVYSKWKSTEILKAIKEGRTPAPGGYEENQGDEVGGEESKEEDLEVQSDPPLIPKVETVEEEDDLGIPAAPSAPPVAPIPPPAEASPMTPLEPPAYDASSGKDELEDEEDQGTEVGLGPPPSYSEESSAAPETLSFVVAPPPPSPSPPPEPERQPTVTPPPPPYETPQKPKNSGGGLFGFGKKKSDKISKAQMADAMELTKFALAALEEKDADMAASRLQQALKALGK